jgi:vesicle transport protein SEC22
MLIGTIGEKLENYKTQAKAILKKLSHNGGTQKMRIEAGAYHFNYIVTQGICYLTLSDKDFPKKLAFNFLQDIQEGFIAELERDHGNSWPDKIATVARPYAFIKFDKFIQQKRREYIDPTSRQNVSRLQSDLNDISDIMKANITEVLDRGAALGKKKRTSISSFMP